MYSALSLPIETKSSSFNTLLVQNHAIRVTDIFEKMKHLSEFSKADQ